MKKFSVAYASRHCNKTRFLYQLLQANLQDRWATIMDLVEQNQYLDRKQVSSRGKTWVDMGLVVRENISPRYKPAVYKYWITEDGYAWVTRIPKDIIKHIEDEIVATEKALERSRERCPKL